MRKAGHILVNIESSVIYVNDLVFSQKGNIPTPPKSDPLLQIHRPNINAAMLMMIFLYSIFLAQLQQGEGAV